MKGKRMINTKLLDFIKQPTLTVSSLLIAHYTALNMSVEDVMIYLQYNLCAGDVQRMADNMAKQQTDILTALQQLVEKQLVVMQTTTTDGKIDVIYSFEPMYQRLETLLFRQLEEKPKTDMTNIVSVFEQEFGRALSSIELETIGSWIKEDKYDEQLIYLALREAVLNQALSLKYIDRILLNWERKNISTAYQVEKERQQYRHNIKSDQIVDVDDKTADILMQNWLKED